ncbi:MAG3090 family protein [Mycoplasmopsis primatum]|uniref:MAG3090 family protein n=1 Tax=Mycoplasmopsis primatum TaxID=55604 RepID=UPI00068ACC81|nr:hypothetical protein [Mycoplasmopsis primatum]
MKRLNCTYEIKQDKEFPWLLKHPKVKFGLAKFKTRQDALNWYMLLDFETAIWFQDDQRIFAGQLTIDSEGDEWYYYIKTAGFDGEATYEGSCRELGINPYNFKRDRDLEKQKGKNIVEGRDYILISDPNSYFPPSLEITKRKRKDVIDLDAIRIQFQQQIDILMNQLHSNNEVADKELELLKAELAKKDLKLEEIANKIDLLKQNRPTLQGVTYEEFIKLGVGDTVGAIALYTEKLKKIIDAYVDKQINKNDFEKIHKNINDFENGISYKISLMDEKNQRLIEKLHNEFSNVSSQLLNLLKVNDELDDTYDNQAFYRNKDEKLIPICWESSFVLVELKHVGFVTLDEYHYSIPYLAVRSNYSVTLVDSTDEAHTITYQSTGEEVVNSDAKNEFNKAAEQILIQAQQKSKPEPEVVPKTKKTPTATRNTEIISLDETENKPAQVEPVYVINDVPTAEIVIVEETSTPNEAFNEIHVQVTKEISIAPEIKHGPVIYNEFVSSDVVEQKIDDFKEPVIIYYEKKDESVLEQKVSTDSADNKHQSQEIAIVDRPDFEMVDYTHPKSEKIQNDFVVRNLDPERTQIVQTPKGDVSIYNDPTPMYFESHKYGNDFVMVDYNYIDEDKKWKTDYVVREMPENTKLVHIPKRLYDYYDDDHEIDTDVKSLEGKIGKSTIQTKPNNILFIASVTLLSIILMSLTIVVILGIVDVAVDGVNIFKVW